MAGYRIVTSGRSPSFPAPHEFLDRADEAAPGLVMLGSDYSLEGVFDGASFVLVELGNECLAVHGGLALGQDNGDGRLLGFARFGLGTGEPGQLVELVRQPWTTPTALDGACAALESAGLTVAVCEDFPGRIVNRLLRPYLNAALRRLDEKLATAEDLDRTLCLGLGYPEGPIALLNRTGLAEHFEVTQALYEALGQEAYAPARAARVAWERAAS